MFPEVHAWFIQITPVHDAHPGYVNLSGKTPLVFLIPAIYIPPAVGGPIIKRMELFSFTRTQKLLRKRTFQQSSRSPARMKDIICSHGSGKLVLEPAFLLSCRFKAGEYQKVAIQLVRFLAGFVLEERESEYQRLGDSLREYLHRDYNNE